MLVLESQTTEVRDEVLGLKQVHYMYMIDKQ